MEIKFIGTSNAFASGGLCWNGFVVDDRILFETPPQVLMSLHHIALDPNKVETIVLSHHHGDHFLGLPFLLLHWKYRERKKPVDVHWRSTSLHQSSTGSHRNHKHMNYPTDI